MNKYIQRATELLDNGVKLTSPDLQDALQNVIDRLRVRPARRRGTSDGDGASKAEEEEAEEKGPPSHPPTVSLFPATDPMFLIQENIQNKREELKQYKKMLNHA